MIQCLVQSLKAELISRPSYPGVPAGRHEAIWGPRYPPTVTRSLLTATSLPFIWNLFSCSSPPPCKVTPFEILHVPPSLSVTVSCSVFSWWMSSPLGVSQPVHHGPRLGIKNFKCFTTATPIFLQPFPSVRPTTPATPSPAPSPATRLCSREYYPPFKFTKHLHSFKWRGKT